MNILPTVRIAALTLLTLSLSGCEPKPEDIVKWKEEGNTSKLIKSLNDSRQFIRLDAIAALEALQAKDAIRPLGALLQDPDVVVVHKSIDALSTIGTPAIEPYMLQAITFETDPARLTAAKALGQLRSRKGVDPLMVALNDQYDNIAVAAAVSLGEIGDPKAIEALSKTAHQGSARLRAASTASICEIGGDSAVAALAKEMGDISLNVRNQVVTGLIEAGDAAEPIALEKLSSENDYERTSAVYILEGIKKVPTTGNDAVWFQLAKLCIGENPKIERDEARKLALIEHGMDALIEAVAQPSEAIREYAFLALETIGEPAAAPLLAAVPSAKPEAQEWFSARSGWAGAPAWQLDLWGAATALNPAFEIDTRASKLLSKKSASTGEMLGSKKFQPSRELIPELIQAMAAAQEESKTAEECRELAFRKLRAYKQRSKFPLMAAVNADDLQIAAYSAEILIGIDDDPLAVEVVIENFSNRIEAGEVISGTPYHDAILKIDQPEAAALLLKIRPNATEAIMTVERKYPGTHVSNVPLPSPDKVIEAEPFLLKYMNNGRAKELRVIFRPNGEGNWVPDPPLPDMLP